MGVAISASADNSPIRANCWQVPCASAIERASNPGWRWPVSDDASTKCTGSWPCVSAETASASVAPVIPPPTIIMLILFTGRRHQSFNIIGLFHHVAGEDFDPVFGDQHVVFDTNTNAAVLLWHISIRRNVQAWFHGDHHARLQCPGAIDGAVMADIVYVQPQPVGQTVHEERAMRLLAVELLDVAMQDPKLHQSGDHHANRGFGGFLNAATRAQYLERLVL